jgi:hypothetical protein
VKKPCFSTIFKAGQDPTNEAHFVQPLQIGSTLNRVMWAEVDDLFSRTQIINDDGEQRLCAS